MQHWSYNFKHVRHFVSRHVRLLRYVGIGALVVIFLMVGLQLAYPRNRLLPGAVVGGHAVGGKTLDAATKEVSKVYEQATLEVHMDDQKEKSTYREIGISVRADAAVKAASHYSLLDRLMPFSFFTSKQEDIPTSFDDERLQYFAEQIAKKYSVAAVNASIKIVGGDVQLVPSQPSLEYSADAIIKQVHRTPAKPHTTLRLAAITTDPPRKDSSAQEALNRAKKVVETPMTLAVSGQQTQVPKETVASWLSFPEDPTSQKLMMSVNAEAVKAYVTTLQAKAYKAPGVTTVNVVDGQEISRVSGAPGQGLDIDGTTDKVLQAINKGEALNLSLETVAIPAKVSYQRSYGNTQAGLTALVNDLGSSSFSIAVAEVGGKGRAANTGGSKRYQAASTYKLYVAYAVIRQIETGAMSWGDQITGGRDAASCFDAMIVVSDNPCAKAFGDKIGWATIDNMMRDVGLVSTSLNNGFYTTAGDLATYLQKLAAGSLMSADGSNRLLDAMKRQIYRSGIPAGTKVTVADKVGFIGGYLHDAGIVYGASGTYVMVFMTSGSSWSAIASASNQIHSLLNR